MARAAKTAQAAEPKKRPGRAPMELEDYLTKPATDTQQRFADWLQNTVGYNPAGARTKSDAFLDGVRLAVAMRIPFQNSDEAQTHLAARRAERNGGGTAKPAKAKATKKEKPAKATKAKPAEKPAPAKAAKTAKKEKATAKPAKAAKPAKTAKPAAKVPSHSGKAKKAQAKPVEVDEINSTTELDDEDVPF